MISTSATFSGIESSKVAIKRATDRWVKAWVGACYLYAAAVVTKARNRAPEDTGYLKASRWVTKPSAAHLRSFEITMGFAAPYAKYVEFGHAYHPIGERMFLSKSVAEMRPTRESFIARETKKLHAAKMDVDSIAPVHNTSLEQGLQAPFRRGRYSRRGRRV